MSSGQAARATSQALVHLGRRGVFFDGIENCHTYSGGLETTSDPFDMSRGNDSRVGDKKGVVAESAREFVDTINGPGAENHARAGLKIETNRHGHTR